MQRTARARFGFRFVTLARIWRRRIEAELVQAGLTDASWTPLIHLDEGGDDISQSELAERVGLDGSSLVRLLDILEGRGLIERRVDPADRRARRIVLTGLGRAEVEAVRDRLARLEAALLVDFDEATLARMITDFDTIAARVQSQGAAEEQE